MHLRCAAPVPDKGWPLKAPVFVDAVAAEVVALVKRQVALVEATIFLEGGDGFVAVIFAKGLKEETKDFLHMLLLVARHVGNGRAGELSAVTSKCDLRLIGGFLLQRLLAQGLEGQKIDLC